MNQVILLGDSIIDNKVYVGSNELSVLEHLEKLSLDKYLQIALDGATTHHVLNKQLDFVREEHSHIVLSVGGNDLLSNIGFLLQDLKYSPNSILEQLKNLVTPIVQNYETIVSNLASYSATSLLCTVYEGDLVGSDEFDSISESAKTIFKPFKDIFTGIKNFMSGDGVGGGFLKAIGGTVGAFLRMVGRIFKPIGILLSFGEGVMEFMKTEGNIFQKLNAGAAKFLADFIGAPLDLLLVKLPAKVMELLGFESASKWIKENVSFEDALFSKTDILVTPSTKSATSFPNSPFIVS